MPDTLQTSQDIFGPNGTATKLLEHVAEKWTALIIYSLGESNKRPSQLKNELGEISSKVLSQTLRSLQSAGIIERTVISTVPPNVEYSLSRHGVTLARVLSELQRWSDIHSDSFYVDTAEQDSSGNNKARKVFERVAEKWTVKIIYLLSQDTKRFNQLKREVEGISQKMLTQTLRNLERDGLIQRFEYQVIPPKVEYSLTDLGVSLASQFEALCFWVEEHYADLKEAYFNNTVSAMN